MHRIIKTLGFGLALWVTPWGAQSATTASMPVSLVIRESCLIQATPAKPAQTASPRVSCQHDTPSLTRLTVEPAGSSKDAPSSTTKLSQTTWLVMF